MNIYDMLKVPTNQKISMVYSGNCNMETIRETCFTHHIRIRPKNRILKGLGIWANVAGWKRL